ncbi:hypothetical protein D1224_15200 [Henriciella barbarensis]|uniref:Sulfotransferase family protein n=1 Tax=Henriciella barbarensis TaxID=86342 RepID=A0A399QQ98_9PROT|nr:sulfotransferase family 2 domain-containing protein [Henriciella barbarensis]RIJ20464.1 hypothetical protein D1224_15200 [Henriciella barbarensis]
MIISDKFQFAFIHIPKCAGTSIRNHLDHLNEYSEFSAGRINSHPMCGFMDYTHIPLAKLNEYFFYAFEKVCAYESFALIRNPYERFFSSLSQHSRVYLNTNIASMSKKQVIESANSVCDQISQKDLIDDYRFIHFEKQSNFLEIDGTRVVKTVIDVSEAQRLLDIIAQITDEPSSEVGEKNAARVFQSSAHRKLTQLAKQINLVRSLGQKLPMVSHLAREIMYKPAKTSLSRTYMTKWLRDFIDNYYARDFEIWRELKARGRSAD